ncbi:uncharacterized protein CANTADRAFT_4334 [Suhomyces tanzawaensis NRRL Y-17324]|uniref:Polyprenol reductase n=1 Tax=Suhomyces tanzawaensis NRRL Y-17324 TaxID=984487 RepID=A0A1E4SS28_9ASCO|nr:uncharacterized protein CANTADRAFT_4334 [Suhomyces tanzawaensis NRRL Y-17324]ODV82323.1 hypothetical protein CANTADRAFT_4334 [Suhomyces tanzawaensis NRRL Y-17324]
MDPFDCVLVAALATYVAAAVTILLIKWFPALNSLLLYGKNVVIKTNSNHHNPLERCIEWVFGLTVPKSYFTHFYLLLTAYCAAILWGIPRVPQVSTPGLDPDAFKNYKIIHYLLWVQGVRRTIECFCFTRFSPSSPINILHYLVGIMHYTLVSVVSGVALTLHKLDRVLALTTADIVLVIAFLAVSVQQFRHHHHLASLKKYSLPAFKHVACPHYFDEIQLYTIIFILSAKATPQTLLVPLSFLGCLVFVLINLGVSSLDSYNYNNNMPRIETVVEIRPVGGIPFKIRSVGIELRTTQKVSVPSTIGSNDTTREYKVYDDPFAYRPPMGEFHRVLLGLDIPVMIPLPKDIIASGMFPNWNASTVHTLCVKISCGDTYDSELTFLETFPIAIKVYDTLPLYRQFNEPVVESRVSGDQQILVDLSLPVSSVGPRDEFLLNTKVLTNHLHNKIKKNLRLNKLTLQIKEILECHEGGLPTRKELKIHTQTHTLNLEDSQISTQGFAYNFQVPFPVQNDYLQLFTNNYENIQNEYYEQQHQYVDDQTTLIQSINISKNKVIDELDEGIPLTHVQGFTTLGRLFSLRYEVIFKAKLSHSKDIEVRLPITVSPYDRVSSDYLLQWIIRECEQARNKFGKQVINDIVNTSKYDEVVTKLSRFNPPPVIYRNIKPDWVRLGYNELAFGKNPSGKALVQYID